MARGFPGPPNTGAAPTPPALRGPGACGLLEAAVPSPDPAAPRFLSPTLQGWPPELPREGPGPGEATGSQIWGGKKRRAGGGSRTQPDALHARACSPLRGLRATRHGLAFATGRGGLPGAVWFGQEGELKARILGSDEQDVPRAGSRGAVEAPPPPARPGPRVLALSPCPVA